MAEIIIDEKIRFGKPVIQGTRITVGEILGALAGGMTHEEIKKEYGISNEDILVALKYAAEIVSEEQVGLVKVKR